MEALPAACIPAPPHLSSPSLQNIEPKAKPTSRVMTARVTLYSAGRRRGTGGIESERQGVCRWRCSYSQMQTQPAPAVAALPAHTCTQPIAPACCFPAVTITSCQLTWRAVVDCEVAAQAHPELLLEARHIQLAVLDRGSPLHWLLVLRDHAAHLPAEVKGRQGRQAAASRRTGGRAGRQAGGQAVGTFNQHLGRRAGR